MYKRSTPPISIILLFACITTLCLCFFCPVGLFAQDPVRLINIDRKKGLPTNFVYDMLVDRYGYLWLATQKGVVKYNGYDTKIFDFSAGLPNEDVWALHEDKKGRIWCSSHTLRIGYIKNDVFKLAENFDLNETLFPKEIKDYKDGVAFSLNGTLYYENNDTFRKKNVADNTSFSFLTDNSELLYCNFFLYHKIRNADIKPDTVFSFPKTDHPFDNPTPWNMYSPSKVNTCYNDDFLVCRMEADTLWRIRKGHITPIIFGITKKYKSKFISFYKKKGFLYMRFNNLILQINNKYELIHYFLLKGTETDGEHTPVIFSHNLWDTVIATNTRGLLIKIPVESNFTPVNILLNNCKLLGSISDTSVWWESEKHHLIFISKSKIVLDIPLPNVFLKTFIRYTRNRLLLLFPEKLSYWLDLSTGKLTRPYHLFTTYVKPVSAVTNKTKDLLMMASSGPRIASYTLSDSGATNLHFIDHDKYKKILYDPFYDCFIFFKYDKLVLYRSGTKTVFNSQLLSSLGVKNIDDVVIDELGNWFLKDNEKIYWINIERRFSKRLKTYVNLPDSKMLYNNKHLVIAGRFGACFYKIENNSTYKYHIVYNHLDKQFENVLHLATDKTGILLNTDNGALLYSWPDSSSFTNNVKDYIRHALLIKYNDIIHNTADIDTLFISQDNRRLVLDVVNHLGNGKLHFKYAINNSLNFTNLSNNELYLEHFTPGEYADLAIVASDNTWVSDRRTVIIYMTPLWWQTNQGMVLVGFCILVFLLLIIFLVITITQKNIQKRTERNQLQMDIELKSIYSQINPHFIFNTLSGTQYFIRENKNQEARLHLNKFSRLLRSYIHSSRNKYISIKDEQGNLINYIELQQIRFADKFDYQIKVAETLDIDNIKIPSLLLQPIVENAINHGLFHVEGYKGLLRLEFYKDEKTNEIVCIIDDNGVGRQRAREIKADSIIKQQSYGDALIKDLINIFNKYEKLNIEIQYIDKMEPESGTTVIIKIKNPVYESRTN